MKVITLGGGFIARHLPYQVVSMRTGLNPYYTARTLEDHKPDVVINCVGLTGRPNIDWCESSKEETTLVNTVFPIVLADACSERSIHLIQIGSGCIYDGKSPNIKEYNLGTRQHQIQDAGWKEADFANPQSYYSKTKYAADLAIGDLPNTTVLRIRMPVSELDDPRNLLNKLCGYSQVIDTPNSMTFMPDLVRCIDWVIQKKLIGIYHVANSPPLDAAQVMTEYRKYIPSHQFQVISDKQLDQLTVAKRSNCILNTDKLTATGFTFTDARQALQQCMPSYIENIRKNNV